MGAAGTVIADFGAFPGRSDVTVTVAAPGIAAGSLVEAWVLPAQTTDHSPDEHSVETLVVRADQASIVPGVSFEIKVSNGSQVDDHLSDSSGIGIYLGGEGTLIYGTWNLGWVWD
jgi:hypothetical protein